MTNDNTAKWYETRRNELLELLREATALDLPEKYADELRQTARKCQEDSFEIALVGEFQGGKSTTFNALCDGRDISPRGLGGGGIKTSAAVISAQNIAGDETKDGLPEWAEVTFKTPGAIALSLSTILRRPLMDSEVFRKFNAKLSDEKFAEAIATDDGFPGLVDLDNDECRTALKSATNVLWSKWRNDRTSLSDDELDELRIATLQLRFYGSAEYRKMVSQAVLPIDKFQKLIAFPKDWMVRWMNGPDSQFTLDEVAFVFVQSVLVRIHSENLRRLGCRITDCPGLFANAYDTSVARRTILNADAVWYLINGEKQIGQKDLEIIRAIAAMGMLGKIEATSNLKGPHEQKIAEIIPATKAALANAGHAVEVFPYNARLAFLAMQGDLLLNRASLFSSLDKANMRIDAKVKEGDPAPETMWTKMVRRVGGSTALENVEDIQELDAESIAVVRRESLLDGILSRLENEIIPQKAQSILVDRGSDRASKALLAYEGVLKATEDAALAKEDEWRAKVDDARRQLADFVDRANTTIDRSSFAGSKDMLAKVMATEIVDMALGDEFIDILTNDIAAILRITSREFYMTRKAMERDLVARMTPVLAEDFKDALTRAIEEWKAKSGSNSLDRLRRSLSNVCDEIHDLWTDRRLSDVEMLHGFSAPTVSLEDITDVCGNLSEKVMSGTNISEIAEKGRRGIFTVIWEVIWPMLLGIIGGIICFPLTAAVFIGKAIWDLTRSEEELERAEIERLKREIEKIFGKVRPEIAKAVSDTTFRNGIISPLNEELVGSVQKIENILRSRLEDLKKDFEKERVAEPDKMFGQSVEERKKIAVENHAIRTQTIEPLRKRIDAFKGAVIVDLSA